MSQYKLWGVYVPKLEKWTKTMGEYMNSSINNTEHTYEIEYFDFNDPRVELYGWKDFPIFIAVKYDQPFRTIVGKHDREDYDNWLRGLNWKINQ